MTEIKRPKKVKYQDDTLEIKNLKKHITSKSVLSDEEVLWLFRKDHSRRTDNDIKKLVDSNLAMVYTLSVQFKTRHENIDNEFHIPFMDIFNSGVIGLYIAIDKFDSIRELKFSTYAYFWISSEIRKEIRRQIYPLKTYSYFNVSRASSTDVVEQTQEATQDTELKHSSLADTMRTVLTPQQITIFNMRYLEEKSVVEVSKILGLSIASIYYHINNIKSKIQEELPELKLDLQKN